MVKSCTDGWNTRAVEKELQPKWTAAEKIRCGECLTMMFDATASHREHQQRRQGKPRYHNNTINKWKQRKKLSYYNGDEKTN